MKGKYVVPALRRHDLVMECGLMQCSPGKTYGSKLQGQDDATTQNQQGYSNSLTPTDWD
ncbi:MAG: hypothetical protein HUK02_08875 [Bacteroidaceae bacterium]|nr:hypothetical protein [Bacteroidaceae bacterium]